MANLIFDYDGTLHESIHIYAPAFRKAQKYLLDKKLIEPITYTDDKNLHGLDLQPKRCGEILPHISRKKKKVFAVKS